MRHLSSTTRFALLALAALGVFGFKLTSRQPAMAAPRIPHLIKRLAISSIIWWPPSKRYSTTKSANRCAAMAQSPGPTL